MMDKKKLFVVALLCLLLIINASLHPKIFATITGTIDNVFFNLQDGRELSPVFKHELAFETTAIFIHGEKLIYGTSEFHRFKPTFTFLQEQKHGEPVSMTIDPAILTVTYKTFPYKK